MILYTYDNKKKEKMDFLGLLYHDRRGGQMIRFAKHGDIASQYSTCVLEDIADTGTDGWNYYTSVNTFRGKRRTADKVYNYCSIYIDLDCHANDNVQIAEAKKRTVKLLEDAYAAGELLPPTMVTDTGRGYGLQYVLDKSIANTGNNLRQREFFKVVRKALLDRYAEIMQRDPLAATVDPVAIDDARVCRIPGTYNANAGAYCRLIYANGGFFELEDIVRGCKLWNWKGPEEYAQDIQRKKNKKDKKNKKIIPFGQIKYPFLACRVSRLEKLIEMRGEACDNRCREQVLFIAYSALVQLDANTAVDELYRINQLFATPLAAAEVNHVISSTDQSKGYDHEGYYMLPDAYLVEQLALTDEEIKILGFGGSWRRAAAKQATAEKRGEIRDRVIMLLKQDDYLTYNQIAAQVGVSRRKVCSIAAEAGIQRHKRHLQPAAAATSTSEDSVQQQAQQPSPASAGVSVAESAKNCRESMCVCVSDPVSPSFVLAALAASPSVLVTGILRLYQECLFQPCWRGVRAAVTAYVGARLCPCGVLVTDVGVQAAVLRDLAIWSLDPASACVPDVFVRAG